MPLFDMADAIAELATGTYTVTRRAAPTNVDGYATAGATSTFSALASITPAPGKVADLLPEGYRGRETLQMFTVARLQTAQGGQVPDLVTYEGNAYEAVQLAGWEQSGNYQHVILVRLPT